MKSIIPYVSLTFLLFAWTSSTHQKQFSIHIPNITIYSNQTQSIALSSDLTSKNNSAHHSLSAQTASGLPISVSATETPRTKTSLRAPKPTPTPLKIPPPTDPKNLNLMIILVLLIVIIVIIGLIINRKNIQK